MNRLASSGFLGKLSPGVTEAIRHHLPVSHSCEFNPAPSLGGGKGRGGGEGVGWRAEVTRAAEGGIGIIADAGPVVFNISARAYIYLY